MSYKSLVAIVRLNILTRYRQVTGIITYCLVCGVRLYPQRCTRAYRVESSTSCSVSSQCQKSPEYTQISITHWHQVKVHYAHALVPFSPITKMRLSPAPLPFCDLNPIQTHRTSSNSWLEFS